MRTRYRSLVWSAGTCVALLGAGVARAAWPVDGSPISVYPCEERPTATVGDDHGGMYVVWTDNRTCSNNAVYMQRVTGSGAIATGWPDGGMPVWLLASGQQGSAAAAPDGSGGVIVVWDDGRLGGNRLFAQRIAPDGARLWTPEGVPVCDAPGNQIWRTILPDGQGGVFVAWMDSRRGLVDDTPHHHPFYDLYAQHIDGSGVRGWSSTGAPVATNALVQAAPSLVTDGASGVLVTWQDRRGPAYFQHLDASGSPHLVADGVAILGPFLGETDAGDGLVVSDGHGGMIAAFKFGPDTQQDLFAQRVDSTGALLWPLNGVLVATAAFDQRPNAIVPDGNGGAFIAWHDLRNGVDWDVYLQRITSTGASAPGWPQNGLAVSAEPGNQIYPKLITDAAGGCLLAWYDARNQPTGYDVYAQRITGAGIVANGWPAGGASLCASSGDQVGPLPAPDGSGGALVAWSDYRVYADVFAQHVSGAGVVGDTQPPLVVPTTVRPRALLVRARSNPYTGDAVPVELSLPSEAPALVTLFDLNGRRIAQAPVPLGAADQSTMRLRLPDSLSPGVYVLQLSQAGRVVSARVALLK